MPKGPSPWHTLCIKRTVPVAHGFGLFDGSPWEYGAAPHIAPTAWFVMAVNGFNPYAFGD